MYMHTHTHTHAYTYIYTYREHTHGADSSRCRYLRERKQLTRASMLERTARKP